VVLQIERVAFGSELRGEKWIDPKPLLTTPAIVCGYNRIHMREGANGGGASA